MVKTALKPTSKSPPASATSKAKVYIPLKKLPPNLPHQMLNKKQRVMFK